MSVVSGAMSPKFVAPPRTSTSGVGHAVELDGREAGSSCARRSSAAAARLCRSSARRRCRRRGCTSRDARGSTRRRPAPSRPARPSAPTRERVFQPARAPGVVAGSSGLVEEPLVPRDEPFSGGLDRRRWSAQVEASRVGGVIRRGGVQVRYSAHPSIARPATAATSARPRVARHGQVRPRGGRARRSGASTELRPRRRAGCRAA